ncbi:MAG TPA: SDR family oxidoreductase, partial [Gaiellaceae bacterium]
EELAALVDRAHEALGAIEILVNNASVFPSDTLETVELEGLQRNLEINAWAPLALTRAFAAQTERGHVVNLLDSRVSGFDRTHVSYILSKHVLAALTRMSALELAPGIAVNGIAPGLILPPAGKDEEYVDRLARTVPLKRRGTPEDIAAAAIFLVTSEFVTGETIYVDGGRHLKENAPDGPDRNQ